MLVADSSYARPELLWAMMRLSNPTMMFVRFRMDIALFAPASERRLVPTGGVNPAKARDY